jgi:hypothetical protein
MYQLFSHLLRLAPGYPMLAHVVCRGKPAGGTAQCWLALTLLQAQASINSFKSQRVALRCVLLVASGGLRRHAVPATTRTGQCANRALNWAP